MSPAFALMGELLTRKFAVFTISVQKFASSFACCDMLRAVSSTMLRFHSVRGCA